MPLHYYLLLSQCERLIDPIARDHHTVGSRRAWRAENRLRAPLLLHLYHIFIITVIITITITITIYYYYDYYYYYYSNYYH